MPRFLVEYPVPSADQLSTAEIAAILQQWNGVLRDLHPEIRLVRTYITEHAIYSLYLTQDPALIREHARLAGLHARRITLVVAIFDPVEGE